MYQILCMGPGKQLHLICHYQCCQNVVSMLVPDVEQHHCHMLLQCCYNVGQRCDNVGIWAKKQWWYNVYTIMSGSRSAQHCWDVLKFLQMNVATTLRLTFPQCWHQHCEINVENIWKQTSVEDVSQTCFIFTLADRL